MLLYSAIMPKSEDKYVLKVVNWSEFHLSEMTLLQNPYFIPSSVEAHAGFFKLSMKGKFDVYLLSHFGENFISI